MESSETPEAFSKKKKTAPQNNHQKNPTKWKKEKLPPNTTDTPSDLSQLPGEWIAITPIMKKKGTHRNGRGGGKSFQN